MITTLAEYEDSIAFELYTLETLRPSIEPGQGQEIDVRNGGTIAGVQVKLSFSTNTAQGAVDRVRDELSPLLFGAAWKVIDLFLEYAFHSAGLRPNRGTTWSITEKQALARRAVGDHRALTADARIWTALTALYAATVEHRHCLVHRTAQVNAATGALDGVDRQNSRLTPLTRAEQIAVSKAAGLVGRAVIGGGLNSRREDHLRYELDQLVLHSQQPRFGVGGPASPGILRLALRTEGNRFFLDVRPAMAQARRVMPTVAHFDLVIDVPGVPGRELRGRGEDAPEGEIEIDLAKLPAWLT